ncbi:hypothetical protein KNJ79_05225 [Sphingopyxis indica]|uniref:hypothetical protein n=1 Tax=Sphingopyxis indica TaxID=436663 RepID=UPI002939280C|nr:hypothetical protein [Sphingopyxis indica]WOF44334.1 hypothetical protein KNJ79_05225 [Sphingopyxis indica]
MKQKHFAVIGHAVAYPDARPYAGPLAHSKEAAIDAWRRFAIANGEIEPEVERGATALTDLPLDTLVRLYDGDEVVLVRELHHD